MTDETTIIKKPKKPLPGSSTLASMSARAFIAIVIVTTVGALALMGKEIKEPLYGGFMIILGAMFNQALQNSKPR